MKVLAARSWQVVQRELVVASGMVVTQGLEVVAGHRQVEGLRTEVAAKLAADPDHALSLAIHGKSAQALEAVLAHADAWPRDAVVLALPLGAFGLYAFSGMRGHDQARVDLCERHAGRFDDDDGARASSAAWMALWPREPTGQRLNTT